MVVRLILFIGLLLAIPYGFHFLLYSATVRFFAIHNPAIRTSLFIALSLLSISFPGSFLLLRWKENLLTRGFYISAAFWMGMFINLLLAIGLICLLIVMLRLVGHNPNTQVIAIVCFGLAACYSVYGVWNAFHPRTKNIAVEIENLPAKWKDRTVVHLSDLHLGHLHGVGFLEGIVEKVNALDPDLVFITGDLFDGMAADFTPFVEQLNNLKTQKGVFFVTGNHEIYTGLDRALEVLNKTKIQVLQNEVVELGGLQIVGISYPGLRGGQEIRNLMESGGNYSKDRPRILLFHTPTNIGQKKENDSDQHFATYWVPDISFAMNKELGINLQLSGHTHKGQIFPFTYLTKLIYKGYDYGLHKEGSFSIYVTSGVGTWGPPMRTGNSPEIVVIKLK